MKNLKKLKHALVAIPAYMLATGYALAADTGVDVGSVVTEIGGSKVSINLIGTAVLSVIVTLAVFLWVRRAIK